MTDKKRNEGRAVEYLREISKGKRQKDVAQQFGVTTAAVCLALKRAGLPSCARGNLESVYQERS